MHQYEGFLLNRQEQHGVSVDLYDLSNSHEVLIGSILGPMIHPYIAEDVKCHCPWYSFIKLITDAAVVKQAGKFGIGVAAWDSEGSLLAAWSSIAKAVLM
ncbi:hypothetical protein ACH5RR_006558 [Cinchona calisaya]|uniref:Uncharacterized protein n=1 Tax=Cinchona calisaya TaxID=153742 RepID=A0ABD3APL9_9GENT